MANAAAVVVRVMVNETEGKREREKRESRARARAHNDSLNQPTVNGVHRIFCHVSLTFGPSRQNHRQHAWNDQSVLPATNHCKTGGFFKRKLRIPVVLRTCRAIVVVFCNFLGILGYRNSWNVSTLLSKSYFIKILKDKFSKVRQEHALMHESSNIFGSHWIPKFSRT